MTSAFSQGNGLLFMKVGLHAQESIEVIIERKRKELETAGKIFWGYGGNTCHPIRMVQPFAKQIAEAGRDVFLVMHKMDSKHFAEPKAAEEYSTDGVNWDRVPKGIVVKGSRYALVLEDLAEVQEELDLNAVEVAVGPSRGRGGAAYIKGRVDKACFQIANPRTASLREVKQIDLVAKLAQPYAVLLR
jgi:hypothetical protein